MVRQGAPIWDVFYPRVPRMRKPSIIGTLLVALIHCTPSVSGPAGAGSGQQVNKRAVSESVCQQQLLITTSLFAEKMNGTGAGEGGAGGGGGGTSVEMDLQALMMGSESLLTHIARPDGIPRLDKSLAEIVSAVPDCPSLRLLITSSMLFSDA